MRISGTKSGILKFFGKTKFAQGDWCGIELDEKIGKNNGSVEDVTYFNCEENFGIFAPVSKVTLEKKEEVEVKRARQNQSAYQSRLSLGLRPSKLRQNQMDSKDRDKSASSSKASSESKPERRSIEIKGKKKASSNDLPSENRLAPHSEDLSTVIDEASCECRDKFPENIQTIEKSSDINEANAVLTASTDTGYQDDIISSMQLSSTQQRSITSLKEGDQLILSSNAESGYQCDLPPLTQSRTSALQDCPVSLVSSTDTGYQGELSPNINSNNATFTIISDTIDKVEEPERDKEDKDESLKEEATVDVIQMSHHSDFSVSVDFPSQNLEVTYDVIQMQHESSSSSNDKENCIGNEKHSTPEKPKKTAEKKVNSLRKPQVKTIPKKEEKPIPRKSTMPAPKNSTFKRPSVPPPKVTTKKPVQIPVVKRNPVTTNTPKVPPIKLNTSNLSDNSSNASFTRLKTSTPVKKDPQSRRLSLGLSKETPTLKQRNINNSTTSVDSQVSRNSISSRSSFSTRNTSKGPPSASSNTSGNKKYFIKSCSFP